MLGTALKLLRAEFYNLANFFFNFPISDSQHRGCRSLLVRSCWLFTQAPGGIFPGFRASKSVDRRILCSWELPINVDFEALKLQNVRSGSQPVKFHLHSLGGPFLSWMKSNILEEGSRIKQLEDDDQLSARRTDRQTQRQTDRHTGHS